MSNRDIALFKRKALQWANTFDTCYCLDANSYTDAFGSFEVLIAAGVKEQLEMPAGSAFAALQNFYEEHHSWMFGLFSYDLKNEHEQLHSENPDPMGFPDLFFFIPQYLIAIRGQQIEFLLGDASILEEIDGIELSAATPHAPLNIQARINRETYLEKIAELQQHISRGDIYEVTYCQQFFAEHAEIDPLEVFMKLNALSPTPFAGYVKIRDQYILSASPERFLRKQGNKLISQPIKGTAKRDADPVKDQEIRLALSLNGKEQAENVMIVDLVRNDLTKSARPGTVKVEELFGIYTFPQVHQMISTISCELHPDLHFIQAIQNTFPMGSMTGAPKIKAMELIEAYEYSKRGAYSGSFGYITPEGDFDFNVVIRSILYHAGRKYLSFQVGGAITYAAVAEAEYEECLLKASAIIQTLEQ